jgi:DsbC/DsbD-like thiol-disulfide interchange protein
MNIDPRLQGHEASSCLCIQAHGHSSTSLQIHGHCFMSICEGSCMYVSAHRLIALSQLGAFRDLVKAFQ